MPNIVQRIALEGGEAVVAILQSIGAAGTKALQQIQQAANAINFDRFNNHLRNLGTSIRGLGSQFGEIANKLGAVFGLSLTAGAAGFATSLIQVARAGTEAADAMDDLASDVGSTIEEVQALQSVFIQIGVNVDGLGEKFRRLAVTTQETWNDIRESVRNASDTVKKNQLGVAEAAVAVGQAQVNLRKAMADPGLGSDDALKREQALLNLRSAKLAVDRATLAQTEAQRKATDDQANTVEALKNSVLALAKGQQSLNQVNLSAENIVKGIVAAAGQNVGALQKLQGGYHDLAATAGPELNAVVNVIADVFKNMQDGALKTAVAVKLFGRGVDHDMIEGLSKGSPALAEMSRELERLGLNVTKADAAVANSFKSAYNRLTNFVSLTRDSIGRTIAPAVEQLIRIITDLLTSNIGRIKAWAANLAGFIQSTLTPAIIAFVNVFRGMTFDEFAKSAEALDLTIDQLLSVQKWQKRWEGIKEGGVKAFQAIGVAVTILIAILDKLAAAINKVFGTEISGEGLGIALLILQFTGLLRVITLVGQAIWALGGIILTMVTAAIPYLAPLLGWPALAIAAFAALAAAIYIYWNEIWAGGQWLFEQLVNGFDLLVRGLLAGFEMVKNAWNTLVEAIAAGAGKVKEFFTGAKNAGQSGASGSYAGGGMIRGPGTGTSDSIIARVSTGEYVVRAAAVRHWGTTFMHAVNAAPGYAMGGLVESLRSALAPLGVPRLAAGGPVGGGSGLRPFNLVMPGGASYGGLYAEGGAVNQLRRAATFAQTSATGRKPSWVR